jgi:HAD superfamily hydrolase (TIGR01509 family)
MIKAIIFDCFGVLAVDGWLPFKTAHFSGRPEQLREVTNLNRQTDAGLLPYDEFIRSVAAMAKVAPEDFRAQIEQTVVNEELLDYIAAELKPTYRIGMLSNVAGHWLEEKFTPEQRKLFDAITLSSRTGFVKPDPRAYEAVLAELGLEAAETLFVDDREGNCSAARQVGMQALLYGDLAQFKHDLTEVLQSK